MRRSIEERFWSKVRKEGPLVPGMAEHCWLWNGAFNKESGHGFFSVGGTSVGAHRCSWEFANNARIPEGLQINHACDNGRCVNPAHLHLGTQKDNMAEKVARGRQVKGDTHISRTMPHRVPRGARHGNTHITEEDVLEIRRAYTARELSQNQLAAKYGMSQASIWAILHRKTWNHV